MQCLGRGAAAVSQHWLGVWSSNCVNMYRIVCRSWGNGTRLKITHGRHAIRAWARAIEPLTGGNAPRRPIAPSIKGAVDLATPLPGYCRLSLVRLLDRLSLCLFAYCSLARSLCLTSPPTGRHARCCLDWPAALCWTAQSTTPTLLPSTATTPALRHSTANTAAAAGNLIDPLRLFFPPPTRAPRSRTV